jgi:hypothetical protein
VDAGRAYSQLSPEAQAVLEDLRLLVGLGREEGALTIDICAPARRESFSFRERLAALPSRDAQLLQRILVDRCKEYALDAAEVGRRLAAHDQLLHLLIENRN